MRRDRSPEDRRETALIVTTTSAGLIAVALAALAALTGRR